MRKMQSLHRRSLARAAMEPLENRQLLSAVIDLRLADGSSYAH
jgi:hypothetical protein